MESERQVKTPKYLMLTVEEFVRLIICIVFDVVEFAIPILLSPLVGDAVDIVGFWAGILMFGWVGCLSLLELVPMADYFPIFLVTWAVWYYRKKRREKRELEKIQKKWM